MQDARLAIEITCESDVAAVHDEAVAALDRGQRISVFQSDGEAKALVFNAIPGLREIAVIGPKRSMRRGTPTAAVASGLAMLPDAWGARP